MAFGNNIPLRNNSGRILMVNAEKQERIWKKIEDGLKGIDKEKAERRSFYTRKWKKKKQQD